MEDTLLSYLEGEHQKRKLPLESVALMMRLRKEKALEQIANGEESPYLTPPQAPPEEQEPDESEITS